MRLMRQTRLRIRRPTSTLDRTRSIVGPKHHFQHVVRFTQQLLTDTKALEDFNRPALHSICLAHRHGPVAALQHLTTDAIPREPCRCAEACGSAPADEHIDFLGHWNELSMEK
jgi:hypothetical protein